MVLQVVKGLKTQRATGTKRKKKKAKKKKPLASTHIGKPPGEETGGKPDPRRRGGFYLTLHCHRHADCCSKTCMQWGEPFLTVHCLGGAHRPD